MKTIGEKIAIARKSKNLSQTDVAKKVNISPQMVSKWERDESLPDVLMLKRLSEIFEESVSYFYDEVTLEDKNQVHEETVKKNIRASFNEYKWNGNDFSKSNIKLINFAYVCFNDCNFTECDITENNFDYTEFKNCQLIKADLSKIKIFRTDFIGTNLNGSDFTESILDKTDLKRCTLKESIFVNTKLDETDFDDCEIENIIFTNVTLKECSFKNNFFKNCNFVNTIFDKCKFKDVIFENCAADKITYNFLLNNKVDVKGIKVE